MGFKNDGVLIHNYRHWSAHYWENESSSSRTHKSRFVGLYIAFIENLNSL